VGRRCRRGLTELTADPARWNAQDGFPSPIQAFVDEGFRCIRANNDRKPGLQQFHGYLKQEDENARPMFHVFNTCRQTIRTPPALPPNQNDLEDVDSGMEDRLYDAIRCGLMSRSAAHPHRYLSGAQTAGSAAHGNKAGAYSPMEDW
jgi:hypothetical protein